MPETLILVHDKAWDKPKDIADSFSHHNAESCGTQGLIAVATHKILVGFDKDEVPKSSLERIYMAKTAEVLQEWCVSF